MLDEMTLQNASKPGHSLERENKVARNEKRKKTK